MQLPILGKRILKKIRIFQNGFLILSVFFFVVVSDIVVEITEVSFVSMYQQHVKSLAQDYHASISLPQEP